MKAWYLIVALLLLVGCRSSKNVEKSKSVRQEVQKTTKADSVRWVRDVVSLHNDVEVSQMDCVVVEYDKWAIDTATYPFLSGAKKMTIVRKGRKVERSESVEDKETIQEKTIATEERALQHWEVQKKTEKKMFTAFPYWWVWLIVGVGLFVGLWWRWK